MRTDPVIIGTIMRSASLAAIRAINLRKLRLRETGALPVICRSRALPLDFSESRPFESSLDRNIEAEIAAGPSVC